MKPIAKASTRKKPATKRPVRKAPARPPVEKPKADETASTPALPPAAPEVVEQPVAPPPDVVPPQPAVATIAAAEEVQVGNVTGVSRRLPLADVLGSLGQPVLDRIAALKGTAAISTLATQMRDTDGQCAPVYFTERPEGGGAFYHGVEALAAADIAGVNAMTVISVPPDATDLLAGHLVEVARQAAVKSTKV